MIEALFTSLTRAVEGAWWGALTASFVWGVLSIVLSPCHLASIPLIVGFIEGQGRMTTRRACAVSTVFSVGILVTIALIGVITALAGRMMGSLGTWGNYVVAGIFFLVGLHLLEVIPMPFSPTGPTALKRKGIPAALMLGLVFGVALGPCTFAFMAPMLAITFRLASSDLWYGVLLLAAYGVGHCAVIVFAGTCTQAIQRYLNWNAASKGAGTVRKLCGVLVLIAGIYMVYIA